MHACKHTKHVEIEMIYPLPRQHQSAVHRDRTFKKSHFFCHKLGLLERPYPNVGQIGLLKRPHGITRFCCPCPSQQSNPS